MRCIPRSLIALALIFALSLSFGGCGGGGSAVPPSTTPDTATDTSGDFDITVHADSANQISVWWDNPTARYAQSPESYFSTVYRAGAQIVPSTTGFSHTDAGLTPETTYCYRAEVTAVYQYFFPYSYATFGWSSGTVCMTTPYGLRVLSTSPASGDVSLPATPVISVTFNGAIDPDSITSDSLVVTGPAGILAGSVAANGATVTFTPDNALLFNTPYTAALSTSVRDTAGNTLATGYQWTFTRRLTLDTLLAVWGSSGSDVFAVGGNGTILHYDGSGWTAMDSGTTNGLRGVWGGSDNNVFAVGLNGTILHYDGSGWTAVDSGTPNHLLGVWGSADNDVFATGFYGTILHYDGSRWTAMDSGTDNRLAAVWGSSGSDVFAVGLNGTILHYDGSGWTAMDSGTTVQFSGVWGSSGSDVFAAGRWTTFPTLLHYDGSAWSATAASGEFYGIWGSSGSDVFAPGVNSIAHFDGAHWGGFSQPGVFQGIWGSSASDVFVVGGSGLILHYDGSAWASMP